MATSVLTNEAGAYNFSNLLPGKYTLSATLPGFQTKNLTNIELSQNTAYRYNFELTVAGVNTQVEVSIFSRQHPGDFRTQASDRC